MVGNELLHNESIRGMVCEACDACHAEMGILSSEPDRQMVMFYPECLIIIIIKKTKIISFTKMTLLSL